MRAFIAGLVFVLGFAATAAAETGKVTLRPTGESGPSGEVRLEDTEAGLKVSASVQDATPGAHGFHIHQFGDCSDAGKAAGDHFNPSGLPHGNALQDPSAAHAGDLGNLEVGADGAGVLEAVLPGVRLSGGDVTVGGRAFVFHEKADDFGQPAGNAGARSACGEIVITGA